LADRDPILAASQTGPGQWWMIDDLEHPYGMVRLEKRDDQVGCRGHCYDEHGARLELANYLRSLRAATWAVHTAFLHAERPLAVPLHGIAHVPVGEPSVGAQVDSVAPHTHAHLVGDDRLGVRHADIVGGCRDRRTNHPQLGRRGAGDGRAGAWATLSVAADAAGRQRASRGGEGFGRHRLRAFNSRNVKSPPSTYEPTYPLVVDGSIAYRGSRETVRTSSGVAAVVRPDAKRRGAWPTHLGYTSPTSQLNSRPRRAPKLRDARS
jgi:hypothetical protein